MGRKPEWAAAGADRRGGPVYWARYAMVRHFSVGSFFSTVLAFKDEIYTTYRMQDWQLCMLALLALLLVMIGFVLVRSTR